MEANATAPETGMGRRWKGLSWDLFIPPAGRSTDFDTLWRLRLMGSVLAVMSALMFAVMVKDLAAYGAASAPFAMSLTVFSTFLGCFLVFRLLGWESAVFTTVFTLGLGVLFYSIFRSGQPSPAMVIWLPILPFLLAVYRNAAFVLITAAVTAAFLAWHIFRLELPGISNVRAASIYGELTLGVLTAAVLALLFRHIQARTRSDLEDQADLVRAQGAAIQRDLESARVFQRGLMPKIRETRFLKIGTVFQPKGQVSGDVYAIYYNREGALNVFLGDASGHGVASAFLTMMVHIGLHNLRADLPPSVTLERLNKSLNDHNLSDMFVTGAFLRIEPTGRMTISHAGHPSVLVRRQSTGQIWGFHENGVPLGMFGEAIAVYQNEVFQLEPGDTVLLHTDGIAEWNNAVGEQYGMERLSAAFHRVPGADVDEDLQHIVQDAQAFATTGVCEDDLSLIALRYTGLPAA